MLNWPPLCSTTSVGAIVVTVQESTTSPTFRHAPSGASAETTNARLVFRSRTMAVTARPGGASGTAAVCAVGAVAAFGPGLRFLEKIGRDNDSTSADAGFGGSSSTTASDGGVQSGTPAPLSGPSGP